MAEYIDREIIRNLLLDYYGLRDAYKSNYRGTTLMDYEVHNMIEDCCDNAPAADVAPVRHGRWGTDKHGLERSICSECGAVYEGGPYNFCPKCGAKMDGGSTE